MNEEQRATQSPAPKTTGRRSRVFRRPLEIPSPQEWMDWMSRPIEKLSVCVGVLRSDWDHCGRCRLLDRDDKVVALVPEPGFVRVHDAEDEEQDRSAEGD